MPAAVLFPVPGGMYTSVSWMPAAKILIRSLSHGGGDKLEMYLDLQDGQRFQTASGLGTRHQCLPDPIHKSKPVPAGAGKD